MTLPAPQASTDRSLERWTGALFLLAASAHGWLAPAHFQEWWGYGLFFLMAGLCQAVWGLALLTRAINPRDAGPRWRALLTAFYWLGIVGTLAAIALYAVTRTVGIPFLGPEAGETEAVAAIDVVTKAAEAVTVVLLALLLRRHLRRPQGA